MFRYISDLTLHVFHGLSTYLKTCRNKTVIKNMLCVCSMSLCIWVLLSLQYFSIQTNKFGVVVLYRDQKKITMLRWLKKKTSQLFWCKLKAEFDLQFFYTHEVLKGVWPGYSFYEKSRNSTFCQVTVCLRVWWLPACILTAVVFHAEVLIFFLVCLYLIIVWVIKLQWFTEFTIPFYTHITVSF